MNSETAFDQQFKRGVEQAKKIRELTEKNKRLKTEIKLAHERIRFLEAKIKMINDSGDLV